MPYANRTDVTRPRHLSPGSDSQRQADQAVQLAVQRDWAGAARANLELLKRHPKDPSTLNRLGNCLSELGQRQEAIAAYERCLQLDPQNVIARKNLGRLAALGESAVGQAVRPGAQEYIVDPGTATVATLEGQANAEALAQARPGAELALRAEKGTVVVLDGQERVLGSLELRLAHRLLALLQGGNRYAVTLASVTSGGVRAIVRETFRHPSQANKSSFPLPKAGGSLSTGGVAALQVFESDDEIEDVDEAVSSSTREGADYPEADIGDEEHDPSDDR